MWKEVQFHVKMIDPGMRNGILEYWINGENNNGSLKYLNHFELQHVYETGDPKTGPSRDMPTFMKNIVISKSFVPRVCEEK